MENICNSVSIMNAGRSVKEGELADLLKVEGLTRIVLAGDAKAQLESLPFVRDVKFDDGETTFEVESSEVYRALDETRSLGLELLSVEPYHRSLEDLFLETIKETAS